MLFRQLFDQESSTYTYLIAADYGREAVIIDPVKNKLNQYLMLIEQLDLKLAAAIDTHLHADHITATGSLRAALNCQILMGEQTQAKGLSVTFKDNEVLDFDGFQFKVLYTPGHTDDSYSLVMSDRVLTGDTLLIRGTGRTDFQHGSPSQAYHSLFNRLLVLPESTLVYPAHDYNGMTVSTIGEEIKFNPRLQVKSEKDYIELMNHLNLAHPKMMDIAVPANQHCGLIENQSCT